jgi:hypothetical protein
MLTRSLRRKTFLLLLITVLATPFSLAAGPQPAKAAEPARFELLSRAWSFLWSVWSKSGCDIDPSGVCRNEAPLSAPSPTKEGCRIDPSGLCVNRPAQQPTNETDIGCQIDPNGLCHS